MSITDELIKIGETLKKEVPEEVGYCVIEHDLAYSSDELYPVPNYDVAITCPACGMPLYTSELPYIGEPSDGDFEYICDTENLRQYEYCWGCGQKLKWPDTEGEKEEDVGGETPDGND